MRGNSQKHVWIRREHRSENERDESGASLSVTILIVDEESYTCKLGYRYLHGGKKISFMGEVPWEDRAKIQTKIFSSSHRDLFERN